MASTDTRLMLLLAAVLIAATAAAASTASTCCCCLDVAGVQHHAHGATQALGGQVLAELGPAWNKHSTAQHATACKLRVFEGRGRHLHNIAAVPVCYPVHCRRLRSIPMSVQQRGQGHHMPLAPSLPSST